MLTSTRTMQAARLARMVLFLALSGCAGGEPATTGSLAQARRLWKQAGIRDYNLEWTSSGARDNHYRVTVRDGQVRSVESIQPDGQAVAVHPAEPRFFGVDGLFLTIEDELAQLKTAAPFGQPKGTKVVLRFTPDPQYGYPRRYLREVLGTPLSLAIHVVRFVPHPPQARSAPSS